MFKGSLFGSLTTMNTRAHSLDEATADTVEESRVSAENLAKVPPFVPPPDWIIIMPPDSEAELESYKWTEKRLAMKFEGGWSICSFRRKAKLERGEREAGQSWFFYKDKGSALLAHKLILAECGPSRTWVIIQEVTKVLKENEATSLLHSVQGSNYARHYKRRMGDVRGSRAGDIRACDCVADRRCLSDSEMLSSIHT